MAELVGIIDTGVLCCWLEVPGRDTAGSADDLWNNARANREIDSVIQQRGTLILPVSTIIETGNHIAQSTHSRRNKALQLFDRIIASTIGNQPWRTFGEQNILWNVDWYKKTRDQWPDYADRRIGLADYSIIDIAQYFSEVGARVRALSTDELVRVSVEAMEPASTRSRRR